MSLNLTTSTLYNLFLIDLQKDFCDVTGALSVPGAIEDCSRIATFINTRRPRIMGIQATLDTHRQHDVAHPMFWVDQVGNNPAPFTLITANDVRTGKWIPTHYLSQGDRQKLMDYTGKLEANGRYSLVIWPPHCLVGSSGMNVQEEVFQAFLAWEQESKRPVNYVNKGYNPFTEHYSVIQADVPDPADASTQPNLNLIRVIDDASKKPNTVVLIGGQALSHCVANSVTDLATHMDLTGKKIVLVRDWCSNVPGFEQLGDDFLAKLPGLGIEILNSSDLV